VLAVALAKDPEKRFARCADFARALGEHTTTVSAPSPLAVTMSAHVTRGPRPTPARSSAERPPAPLAAPINSSRRWWLILAAILYVALLACAIGLIWQPWRKGLMADPGPSLDPYGIFPSIDAHGSYWNPGNVALRNMGAVIAGAPPPVIGYPSG
jgi:hypothetical protein